MPFPTATSAKKIDKVEKGVQRSPNGTNKLGLPNNHDPVPSRVYHTLLLTHTNLYTNSPKHSSNGDAQT